MFLILVNLYHVDINKLIIVTHLPRARESQAVLAAAVHGHLIQKKLWKSRIFFFYCYGSFFLLLFWIFLDQTPFF